MVKKQKLLSLLLALVILISATPFNVFAAEKETVEVTFTDGNITVTEEYEKNKPWGIPDEFKPPEGKMITALIDEDGKYKNPMELLRRDEFITIEYGDKIEATFSIVGNEVWNGEYGFKDQLARPRKITITYDEIQKQKEKYNFLLDRRYVTVSNILLKAFEEDPELSPQLTDDFLKYHIGKNYIGRMFELEEFLSHQNSGWMYYTNHYYVNVGLLHGSVFDKNYIRWFYVDNYANNAYTWFDDTEIVVDKGEEINLTLNSSKYDMWEDITAFGTYSGAKIIVDDNYYEVDGKIVKTDSNGKATVIINTPGKHFISAKDMVNDEHNLITMPYLEVLVLDKDLLKEAIQKAEEKSKDVEISKDGNDILKNSKWVTEEMHNSLDQALKNAKDILPKKDVTQETINEITSKLNGAIENYKPQAGTKEEKVPVDKKALEDAILKAQSIEEADKTSVDGKDVEKDMTWVTEAVQKALDESLRNAIDTFNSKDSTQEEVNAVTEALTTSIENYKPQAGLKKVFVDKTKLNEAIMKLETTKRANKISVDGSDVEPNKTWVTKEASDALNHAENVGYDLLYKDDATLSEVNEAIQTINRAIEGYNPKPGTKGTTIDKTELYNAINKAESIKKADIVSKDGKDVEPTKTWVTEESKQHLENSLIKAKEVYNSNTATKDEVELAKNNLINAINDYNPKPGLYSDYKEYYITVRNVPEGANVFPTGKMRVTSKKPITVNIITEPGFKLKNIKIDDVLFEPSEKFIVTVDNTEPDSKVEIILEKIDVNKKALEEAIQKADNLTKADFISEDGTDVEKDKTWVTEKVNNALNSALTEAKKIMADEKATQDGVNAATEALTKATENYKPAAGKKEEIVPPVVIDKTELEKAIKTADELPKADAISKDGTDVEKDKTWVTEVVNNALNEVLTEAKKVMANDEATQDDVNAATNALSKATENYNPVAGTKEEIVPPVDVDTTKLEAEIKYLEKLLDSYYVSNNGRDVPKDRLWITPLMKENLLKSLNEAKGTLNNNSLTSEELEKAISELTEAIKEFNKPEVGKAETRPIDPRPVDPRPVDPIYPRPSRPEGDRYDYGHNDYAPFLPGLGFVTPGRVYTTPSVDTRPSETRPTETKPTNEIKPVVPVFTDIIGHWAEPTINSVVAKDYFKGTGPNTFSPNRAITRAEIVTVLGRIAGVNPANYTNTTMTDVEHGSYYEGYVNWAVEKGIVNGVGENKFDPNSEASREEVATIISRYLDMIGKNTTATSELSYKDSQEISQWAKDAVNKLTELGVFNGQDGNKFAASESITRAEIAQVIYNMDNANLIK